MNTEQLEHELRERLNAAADGLPTTAGSRVRAHDYRPRTRSLRPPIAAGALAAAAAAGAAVWVVSLSSQTPSAFAGWTATPTAGSPSQLSAAESACRHRLTSPAPALARSGGGPALAGGPEIAHLRAVLTDTRGPFTWVIFADQHGSASCISGPSFTEMSANASSAPQTVSADRIQLSSLSRSQTPSGGSSYSFIEGRAGSGVTAATLVLSDGTHVQATLQNGWFVAWWPGDRSVRSALVTTSGGTTTETLPADARSECPPPPKAARGAGMCTIDSRAAGGSASSRGSASSSGSASFGGSVSSGGVVTGSGGASGTQTQTTQATSTGTS